MDTIKRNLGPYGNLMGFSTLRYLMKLEPGPYDISSGKVSSRSPDSDVLILLFICISGFV